MIITGLDEARTDNIVGQVFHQKIRNTANWLRDSFHQLLRIPLKCSIPLLYDPKKIGIAGEFYIKVSRPDGTVSIYSKQLAPIEWSKIGYSTKEKAAAAMKRLMKLDLEDTAGKSSSWIYEVYTGEGGGSRMTYREIQDEVIQKYRVAIDENSSCRGRMHAHVKEKKVCKWHPKNSIAATFDLFHEIGHIETTTSKMRRAEEEYYATLWAFERLREYRLKIPESIWKKYQDYIYRERDRGVRRGGTRYMDMELPRDVIA